MSAILRLLLIQDLADALGLSPVTVSNWAYRKKPAPAGFPAPIRIGNRLRWRAEDVQAWLDKLQMDQTQTALVISTAGRRGRGRPRLGAEGQGGAA